MKKIWKVLLTIMIVCALLTGGLMLLVNQQVKKTYERLDAVETADLSMVKDGVYEGIEETAPVKVTVQVTVHDHLIKDIRLIRHENGKGTPAEAMIPQMILQNTSEVDTVAGATMSGKTIRAAVRRALQEGFKE